ncbi:MAG TPA: KUP/HAK/KT family potassium transporter [Caulobacteraceae bacterium]
MVGARSRGAAGSPENPSIALRSKWAALLALGIVYGDLGTSPLYTLQAVAHALGGPFTAQTALGVLSLIVWTLIVTVSVKYCLLVMRADNHGEGGILALMSLVGVNSLKGRGRLITAMGLMGAALIYGDGVITPSISVLSALEGVNVVTAAFKPYVMPGAAAILIGLFSVQRFGAAKIGDAFGPIMLIWFMVIAGLGLTGIVHNPSVLGALDPRHAAAFLAHSHGRGLAVLGGVFLCITGAEALYADIGPIGRGPIRLSWYGVVLPALLLSYAGQTAVWMQKASTPANPFFLLAPHWAIYPLVLLATVATVIASQAIITGVFSMTRQAMQMGWLPAVNIHQTSAKAYGQIYIPAVSGLMMIATVGITIAFRSSDRLAGAYGTAVSLTMLLTTCLLYRAMRHIWRWPLIAAAGIAGPLLVVDGGFFCANLLKIVDGGWLPLSLAMAIFFIMSTWRAGIDAVRSSLVSAAEPADRFIAQLEQGKIPRVAGTAVFLSRTAQQIPSLIIQHVRYMGALHRDVIALRIVFEDRPRIADAERSEVEPIVASIWRVTIRFGFSETPDIPAALAALKGLDPAIDIANAVYFAARDLVTPKSTASWIDRWRMPVFAYFYRNAVKVVDRFHLPAANVVELARQIEI